MDHKILLQYIAANTFYKSVWIWVAVLLMLLSACSKVDLSTLPPVPQIKTDTFLPGVQAQLTSAFEAVESDPGDAINNAHLAKLLQTYKQFEAAAIVYERARILDPESFELTYLHALTLAALGNSDQAIKTLRHAITLREDYVLAKIHLADQLVDLGEMDEAGELFSKVMRNYPGQSEAHFSYGKYLLQTGNTEAAITAFKKTIELSGNMGVAFYQLGLAYRDKNLIELAEENFSIAQKHLGYSGDSSDQVLNQLLPLNLSDTPFVHRAKVLAENGRMEEAERFIKLALERNPQSVGAHTSMIGMAASKKEFQKADEHFSKAIEIDPNNAKIYFNLGLARIAEQRWVDATKALEKSLQLDDTDPNAHVQLAILKHKDDQFILAKRHLRKALALNPRHTLGNWLLGELLHEQNKSKQALPYLQKAVTDEHPLIIASLSALAEVHIQLEQWDEAQRIYVQAKDRVNANTVPGVVERLAVIAEQLDSHVEKPSEP